MPTNKNASLRYRIIDDLLKGGKSRYTMEELLERVNEKLENWGVNPISERTLRGDIQIMRRDESDGGFGAPIICDYGEGYYYYSDPDFSIRNAPLNPIDIANLHAAWEFLRGMADLPLVKMVEEALKKLEDTTWTNIMNPLIQFDFPPQIIGVEYLMTLLQAIRDKNQIVLSYQPFDKEIIDKEIIDKKIIKDLVCDPWMLKEFNGRWFLVAGSPLRKGVSLFALDRIKKLEVTKKPAAPPITDLNRRFSQAVGVSIPDEAPIEEVILRFNPYRARYVLSKPMHKSQKVLEETHDYVRIQLKVIITRELVSLIHYFGPDVVVESPESLRELIRQHIGHLLKEYSL